MHTDGTYKRMGQAHRCMHTDGTCTPMGHTHRWDMYTEDMHIEGTYSRWRHTHTEGTYTRRKYTYEGDIHTRSRRIRATDAGSSNARQPSVPSLSALPNSKSNNPSRWWDTGPSPSRCRFCYWDSEATGLAPTDTGLTATPRMTPQARICVPGPGPGTACQPCASSAEAHSFS